MKQIIIDSEAENDLSDSVGFYERQEPGLGLEFERAAREAVQTIQVDPDRNPLAGINRDEASWYPSKGSFDSARSSLRSG